MSKQDVIISQNIGPHLEQAIAACQPDKIFILTDSTTHELCLPLINHLPALSTASSIVIGATDEHKTLEALAHVWQ